MGIFDSESDEEVKISPSDNDSREESKLKEEVETEIVGQSSGSEKENDSRSSRGRDIRKRSNSSGKSSFTENNEVDLEDIHKQNERIIELLENISGEKLSNENKDDNDVTGDLNGVL